MSKMKYPINIKSDLNREQLKQQDQKTFVIYMSILGIIGLTFVINYVLKMFLKVPFIISVILSLIISLLLFLVIFKHFIFKEDEKLKKLEKQGSESFARFYNLSKDVNERVKLPTNDEIPIFEYKDGNYAFVLEFKFGSNSHSRTINQTFQCFEKICNILGKNNYSFNIIVSPENFISSAEYKEYINKLGSYNVDKQYTNTILNVVKHMTSFSSNSTGVNTIHIIARTRASYQKYSMNLVMHSILDSIWSFNSGFRSIKFLDGLAFKDFMTTFYGLGAIDLSKYESDSVDLALKEKYARIVRVYEKVDYDGNAQKYDVLGNTFRTNASEVNNNANHNVNRRE